MATKKKSHFKKVKEDDAENEGSFPSVDGHEEDDGFDDDKSGKKKKSGSFQSMGLSTPVYRGITKKGYRLPTPIQRKSIPLIMGGHDVVAMARTGSGKTAAFLVPMLERLREHSQKVGVRAVIVSPTRELAMQTMKFVKELARYTDLLACLLVGGDSMEDQFSSLARNPDILVATPGRLVHHLVEVGLSLKTVEYVVFDEADRLFEMGFEQQLRELIQAMPENRQTLLFSATMPKMLVDFVRAGLRDPQLVRLDTESRVSESLNMQFYQVRSDDKLALLLHLLTSVIPKDQQTIIFTATKHHVEFLHEVLKSLGMSVSAIYGSMDQSARKMNLLNFRNKKTQLLIVTDVAARGIDIPLLDNVINYDFPGKPKLFVHRVGRTARAGNSGNAYSFVLLDEMPYMVELHLFLGRPLRSKKSSNEPFDIKVPYYGAVPSSLLELPAELVRKTVHDSVDLTALEKTMHNSIKMYTKTLVPAAPEHVKRAKQLDREIHPMFATAATESQADDARSSIISGLKNFRPAQNILEITGKNAKRVSLAKAGQMVMQQKRDRDGGLISQVAQAAQNKTADDDFQDNEEEESSDDDQKEIMYVLNHRLSNKKQKIEQAAEEERAAREPYDEIPTVDPTVKVSIEDEHVGSLSRNKKASKNIMASFSDDKFFLNSIPKNYYAEKALEIREKSSNFDEAAILDLAPDEKKTLLRNKQSLKWDRRRKKYVQVSANDTGDINSVSINKKKRMLNESGAPISERYQTKRYERWKQNTKLHIPMPGESEVKVPTAMIKKANMPNKWKRTELKPKEVVAKERLRKHKIQERQTKMAKRKKIISAKKSAGRSRR